MASKVVSLDDRRRGIGRSLKFAFGISRNTNAVQNKELRWSEFTAMLKEPKVGAESMDAYLRLPTSSQIELKDVGHFTCGSYDGNKRAKAGIHAHGCGVLDVDHCTDDTIEKILNKETGLGSYQFFMHTTRKDREGARRLRIIFPLTRDVNALEYGALTRIIANSLNGDDTPTSIEWFDHTGFEFTRVMFWPSVSADQEYVYWDNPGAWIEPDEWLAYYDGYYTNMDRWPVSSRYAGTLQADRKKAGVPWEKPGVIGAFCRTFDIHSAIEVFLSDIYVPGSNSNRMTYAKGSSADGAVIYEDGHMFSRHETDPAYYQNLNAFDLVRVHLFGDLDAKVAPDTKINELPSYGAMRSFALEDPDVAADYETTRSMNRGAEFDDFDIEEYSAPAASGTKDTTGDLTAAPTETARALPVIVPEPTPEEKKAAEMVWRKALHERAAKNDEGGIKPTLSNLMLILSYDPIFVKSIAFNEFTLTKMQMKPYPGMSASVPPEGIEWSDLAGVNVRSLIERRHNISFSTQNVTDAVDGIGDRHRFHPVRNYLKRLPAWDGVDRIETFFVDVFGADNTPYTREVTRKFFAGAVARVMHPGIKFDFVLVLEGPEDRGKSTVFKILSRGWFTDGITFGMDSKEFVERSSGSWICEFAEMLTKGVASAEHTKAFVSRQVEKVRLAYARNAITAARQCVFVGTTNESQYLMSITGNRRFWPVKGDGRYIDMAAVAAMVDQLWAEAMVNYAFGEKLWIDDPEIRKAAAEIQAARVEGDEWAPIITEWLDVPTETHGEFAGKHLRDKTNAADIWVTCLQGAMPQMTNQIGRRINTIMRQMPGWEYRVGVTVEGHRGRGFTRIIQLPTQENSDDHKV